MKRILLASVAALGLAGTASAADLAVKAPVVYAPVFTWTGCYLGVNAGWINGRDKYQTEPDGRYLWDTTTAAQRAEVTHSYSSNQSAGTAGGQFGCQTQFGSIVLGAEWDAQWSGLAEDNYFSYAATPDGKWNRRDEWTHKELDWFTTARVRLGWAWDRVLLYATGGLAVGALDSYTQLNFYSGPSSASITDQYYGAYRKDKIGYAVGGGIEWAFANNWTAKAEFLYLDFGSFGYWSPTTCTSTVTCSQYYWNSHIDASEYVARVGLNYLFHTGGAPVVAKY